MGKPRGTPYSQDLRDRVLDATGKIRDLADRFGVSPAYSTRSVTGFLVQVSVAACRFHRRTR
jgi:hypothetical protein